MKTTYPSLLKSSVLLFAIIFTQTTLAQNMDIAAVSKQSVQRIYTGSRPAITSKAIKFIIRTDKKIVLTWSPFKGGVSHYVLERSFDGRSFEEAGLFFAGDWSEPTDYVYNDRLKNPYAGPLMYRLRVVGVDESEVYTSVSISEVK